MKSSSKSERLAIYITAADKSKLERAAALQRRSLPEFVLASSREAAEHVLGERTRFRLPPAKHRAFLAALDAPAREIPELKRLFSSRSVHMRKASGSKYVERRKDAGVTEKLNGVYADAGNKAPHTPRRAGDIRRQRSLVALAGSGKGLWGKDSSKTLRALRNEWQQRLRTGKRR